MSFRFPGELHRVLSDLAEADERSLNLYVVRVLRAYAESALPERFNKKAMPERDKRKLG